MDDLLLASNSSDAIAMVKDKLKQRFKMADMGAVSLVLGMETKRDLERGTLTISSRGLLQVHPGGDRNVGMKADQHAGVRSRTLQPAA